jgi:hypothetical protein
MAIQIEFPSASCSAAAVARIGELMRIENFKSRMANREMMAWDVFENARL